MRPYRFEWEVQGKWGGNAVQAQVRPRDTQPASTFLAASARVSAA
jgi:hypothetical protein